MIWGTPRLPPRNLMLLQNLVWKLSFGWLSFWTPSFHLTSSFGPSSALSLVCVLDQPRPQFPLPAAKSLFRTAQRSPPCLLPVLQPKFNPSWPYCFPVLGVRGQVPWAEGLRGACICRVRVCTRISGKNRKTGSWAWWCSWAGGTNESDLENAWELTLGLEESSTAELRGLSLHPPRRSVRRKANALPGVFILSYLCFCEAITCTTQS